jgi:hypothetical protein
MVCAVKLAAVALVPLLSLLCLAQTKPLSVCDILTRPSVWNDNVVLVQAHYGWGMQDSFLWDERCRGEEIFFNYPQFAAKEDALLKDKLADRRTPVILKRDKQLADFEQYRSQWDEKNPMCPELDIIVTVRGRIDSKRSVPLNKKCLKPFGMCNYQARLVLESVQEVGATDSKPKCSHRQSLPSPW